MKGYIAGLDIGGTSGRLRLEAMDGTELGEVCGQGCSINTDGSAKSEERYRALVLPALEDRGLSPRDCSSICIAASGIDSPELEAACRQAFQTMGFRDETIHIYNDCEIFLNLSDRSALILVAGTGSICYGRTKTGKVVRTGGWGHILSDEGSAFRIGMDVLEAIGDHLDKRSDCPFLYQKFQEQTGINNLSALNEYVNENLMNKAVIGNLAPLAEQSMHAKEPAGAIIIEKNAQALFRLVDDTVKKMDLAAADKVTLYLWGSVLVKNEPLRNRLINLLSETYPQVTTEIPQMRALDVAVMVAKRWLRKTGDR